MISSFTGEYAFLSNFYGYTQVAPWYGSGPVAEVVWRTNEHYFQAAKAVDFTTANHVRLCLTPTDAKRVGRTIVLRPDWDAIKLDVMLTGLRAKFTAPPLAEKLLDTGDLELVEWNTWGDTYWGGCGWRDGRDPVGSNWLGKLLMLVREETKGRMR